MTLTAWLILNPKSGQGDLERDLATIRALLDSELDLVIRLTGDRGDAERFAREGVAANADYLIAAGGDGTVSTVAGVAMESGTPVGTIPRGTANAFAKALAIPEDVEAACQAILTGRSRQIDGARCANGKPMVLWAGVGVGAEAIAQTESDSKERLGRLAYVLSGVQQLQTLKQFRVEVETEDRIAISTAAAVTIANAAPPSSVLAQGRGEVCPDDGWLDVTVFAPQSSAEAIAASYDLLWAGFDDRAAQRSDVGYLRAKSVKVRTNPLQTVAIDGEIAGRMVLDVTCIPNSLTVLVPSDSFPSTTDDPPLSSDRDRPPPSLSNFDKKP